jgi:hypothetical protein
MVELEGEDEIGKEGLVQVGKDGTGARPEGMRAVGEGRGWGGEREGEGVVKKMGAWTTGKGPKGRGRKKEASKEASGAECVWAVGLCLWGGTGEERTPWLAGWRPMGREGRAGRLQKEGLVAHALSCRTHVYIHLSTLPSPSTKRNAARGARAMTSADSMDPRLYLILSLRTCTYRMQCWPEQPTDQWYV